MFGKNLVTTEGAEWKAHRRVVGPSFTEVRTQTLAGPAAPREAAC